MKKDYSEIRRQLSKYCNVNSLKAKHKEMKGNKATGIDKVSKKDYEKNLDYNVKKLIEDMKNFSYKPNGKTRNGYYKVGYKTNEKKSKLKKQKIKEYIKINIQTKSIDLIKGLNRILIGLYNYYGISFNFKWLEEINQFVVT